MESQTGPKKIARACARCKKRKIRCDGNTPSCANCAKCGDECLYAAEVKRRGVGKSKDRIKGLEERLMEMEAKLDRAEPRTQPDSGSARQKDCGTHDGTACDTIPPDQTQGSPKQSGHSLDSSSRHEALYKSISERVRSLAGLQQASSNVSLGVSPAVIPTTSEVFLLVGFLRDTCREIPFLQASRFLEKLAVPGSLERTEDLGWWTLLNVTIAVVARPKTANDAFEKLSFMIVSFYKNSIQALPGLLLRDCDQWSVQACFALAFFMHGQADARATAALLATAIRQLQIFQFQNEGEGLCRGGASDSHALHHVFWGAFILDSAQHLNTGLPSSLPQTGFGIELPLVDLSAGDDVKHQRALRARSELALLQRRIGEKLYGMNPKQEAGQMMVTIREVDCSLERWRALVPTDVWSGDDGGSEPLDITLAMLRLAYYSCVSFVSWAVIRRRRELSASEVIPAAAKTRASARESIRLVKYLDNLPFIDLWQIMRYLLAAAITLLVFIVEDANHAEVHRDLAVLEDLAAYVTRLVEVESCDFQDTLAGIRQILNMAVAVSRGQCSVSSPEIVARLHDCLVHPMRVAQRWMGNLARRDEAADILAAVLSLPPGSGSYGPLTSRSMRSDTYGLELVNS